MSTKKLLNWIDFGNKFLPEKCILLIWRWPVEMLGSEKIQWWKHVGDGTTSWALQS